MNPTYTIIPPSANFSLYEVLGGKGSLGLFPTLEAAALFVEREVYYAN